MTRERPHCNSDETARLSRKVLYFTKPQHGASPPKGGGGWCWLRGCLAVAVWVGLVRRLCFYALKQVLHQDPLASQRDVQNIQQKSNKVATILGAASPARLGSYWMFLRYV